MVFLPRTIGFPPKPLKGLWLLLMLPLTSIVMAAHPDHNMPTFLRGSSLAHQSGIPWVRRQQEQHLQQQLLALHKSNTTGSVFKTTVKGTAFVYLTHLADQHHLDQTQQLAAEFGDRFTVLTPQPLPELPGSKVMTSISSSIPDEHWKQFSHTGWGKGGILLGHAMLMMLADPDIDHLWIMENDVFFRDVTDVRRLVESYGSDTADYIPVSFSSQRESKPSSWHFWGELTGFLPQPWYCSTGPIMRISKPLVAALVDLDHQAGHLAYFEAVLPTLAMQQNMRVRVMDTKFTGHVRFRPCWTKAEIDSATGPGVFFHPVKVENGTFVQC